MQVIDHVGLIDVAELRGFQDGIVESQFLSKTLRHQTLSTSGRAVQQDAVDGKELVFLCLFRVLQPEDHFFAKLFLETVATSHLIETIARTFLEHDTHVSFWDLLRDLTGIFRLVFFISALSHFRRQTFQQGIEQLFGR